MVKSVKEREVEVIDAHAHFHNLSIFDRAGFERAKEMYERFRKKSEKKGTKIIGVGCIVLSQEDKDKSKEFPLNLWKGIYCDYSLCKIDEWEKYDFLKIHEPFLLTEKKVIEKIEKAKRVQLHGDIGLLYHLDTLSRINAKFYIAHGVYLISRSRFFPEKRKELEDFLQEKEVYLGVSPPDLVLNEEEHKNIVSEVTECYSNTVFETDFAPYEMPHYFEYLNAMVSSISKLLEENEGLAYKNALNFFTSTSSGTWRQRIPNIF